MFKCQKSLKLMLYNDETVLCSHCHRQFDLDNENEIQKCITCNMFYCNLCISSHLYTNIHCITCTGQNCFECINCYYNNKCNICKGDYCDLHVFTRTCDICKSKNKFCLPCLNQSIFIECKHRCHSLQIRQKILLFVQFDNKIPIPHDLKLEVLKLVKNKITYFYDGRIRSKFERVKIHQE